MLPYDYHSLVRAFYQCEGNYKKFEELTDDEIEILNEEANRLRESLEKEMTAFDRYTRMLLLIKSKRQTREFDKHLYLLINTIDPELVTYKLYRTSRITSKIAINNAKNTTEKEMLELQRKKDLLLYESSVRNEIGIYEPRLAKFERDYYNKFCLEKENIK